MRSLPLVALCAVGCANLGPELSTRCLDALPKTVLVGLHPRERLAAGLARCARKNAERADELERLFVEAGCAEGVEDRDVAGSASPNVICRLHGTGPGVIVVGAHYDKVPEGHGVVDNWSGAALLPVLYESLARRPRAHTVLFVGFTDEEVGLIGSRAFVDTLKESERAAIRAMVNLDTLGLGRTKVEVKRSDPELLCTLRAAAESAGVSLAGMDVDRVGTSDWQPFKTAGIPVLSVHSVTPRTFPILHSEHDRIEAMDLDAYYDTYRLVAVYLALLDAWGAE